MRRFIPIGAVALTLVAAPVAAATATDNSPRPSSLSSTIPFKPTAGESCYQNDVNDAAVAVISQNFEPDFDAYDTRGADDFTLSSRCRVKEVDVVGWYNDSGGQATSLDVRFYADHAGTPGPPTAHRHDLAYVDPTHLGSFQIPLGRPVTLRP